MKDERFAVSWSVGGTDVRARYDAGLLFGPAPEDESVSFLEWLLRGLARDGFEHLTFAPLGGLGDALRAVEDGVSQVSWPPAERFAADLDTETGSDVLTDPWMCGHYDETYGSCRRLLGHDGEHLYGRPLDTGDAL